MCFLHSVPKTICKITIDKMGGIERELGEIKNFFSTLKNWYRSRTESKAITLFIKRKATPNYTTVTYRCLGQTIGNRKNYAIAFFLYFWYKTSIKTAKLKSKFKKAKKVWNGDIDDWITIFGKKYIENF